VVRGGSMVVRRWPGASLVVVRQWSDGLRWRNSNSKNDLQNLKMEIFYETKESFLV
jgi:hypothetical protein